MRRRPGILDQLDSTNTDAWIRSLGNPTDSEFDKAADQYLNPGKDQVVQMIDDDLATLIGREPATKLGQLAASELRRREAWRSPAKWTFVVSGASLLVAIVALARTL